MSELPGRPDLQQLRRQARELLRAAAGGDSAALARIQAVSPRVSLSAAQLALAREYGFSSWPALHADVERRVAELSFPGPEAGRAGDRWSFGGAAPVETKAGILYPGGLLAGPGQAVLYASLLPSGETQDRLAVPSLPMSTSARAARAHTLIALGTAVVSALTLTDDQGTTYALHVDDIQHSPDSVQERGPVSLRLGVDPVPARERGWLELRGQRGSASRLLASRRPDARVSGLAPGPRNAAAQELSELALHLIGLTGIDGMNREELQRYCSDALARTTQIEQSAGPGAVGDLPRQLARLCAFLTGRGPADGLPAGWAGIVGAANRVDGARQHLDISAVLPPVEDTVVQVDSLVSEPASWKLYLRAAPSWWITSADGSRKRAVMLVRAEDDLGGLYVSTFGGSSRTADRDELTLHFLPRLDPAARSLVLTFTHGAEQVTVELQLP